MRAPQALRRVVKPLRKYAPTGCGRPTPCELKGELSHLPRELAGIPR